MGANQSQLHILIKRRRTIGACELNRFDDHSAADRLLWFSNQGWPHYPQTVKTEGDRQAGLGFAAAVIRPAKPLLPLCFIWGDGLTTSAIFLYFWTPYPIPLSYSRNIFAFGPIPSVRTSYVNVPFCAQGLFVCKSLIPRNARQALRLR